MGIELVRFPLWKFWLFSTLNDLDSSLCKPEVCQYDCRSLSKPQVFLIIIRIGFLNDPLLEHLYPIPHVLKSLQFVELSRKSIELILNGLLCLEEVMLCMAKNCVGDTCHCEE